MALESREVILDCDTGADDALAILMAVGLAPHVRLVGVTTVHGNAIPSVAYDNTCRVLAAAGAAEVPVVAGATCELRALDNKKRPQHWSNGDCQQGKLFDFLPETARDGVTTTADKTVENDHAAATWLAKTVREHPGIALVLTAPLTNVALALRQDPSIAQQVGAVAIMGGSFGERTYAEFNFACDGLAAAEVLSANWAHPPIVVGLNLTCQAMLPPWLVQRIGSAHDDIARTAAKILRSIDPAGWNESSGDGWEMYDACALAAWFDPTLVECSESDVWVDPSRGRTLMQCPANEGNKAALQKIDAGKIRVAVSISKLAFFELMLQSMHASQESSG
eukprot:gnl/TRDRNA2_/TRDRNA2_136195_c0_seq1.p1 gnl/TRDRNA2_/TRDRNA2_136195_c0~~gnl/TRDRNA2_/TRDRNA2_136195_c0_seq1.p1  ORF type:complete len:336 (+),score=44.18 gnl/TRDRNA2_/TRDRNA2_136195_c0_seq1:71-1078(+)